MLSEATPAVYGLVIAIGLKVNIKDKSLGIKYQSNTPDPSSMYVELTIGRPRLEKLSKTDWSCGTKTILKKR